MSGSNIQGFRFNEEYLSQIPALQLLASCGYEILTPQQALEERQSKNSNVLLEGVLREQLQEIQQNPLQG